MVERGHRHPEVIGYRLQSEAFEPDFVGGLGDHRAADAWGTAGLAAGSSRRRHWRCPPSAALTQRGII